MKNSNLLINSQEPQKSARRTTKGSQADPRSLMGMVAAEVQAEAWELPFQVYYHATHRRYLIRNGKGRWLEKDARQFRRQLKLEGCDPDRLDGVIQDVEDHLDIDYAGLLAGRKEGFYEENGIRMLVTSSPEYIDPVPGAWPTLRALMEGMLVNNEPEHGEAQWQTFLGWLRGSVVGCREGTGHQAQVLAIAGPAGAGKSLFQHLFTHMVGGRAAKPFGFMSGSTQFNAELFGAEHMMLEDECADDSSRARKRIAATLKQFTVSTRLQPLHAKGKTQINVSPWWRVTASLNDTPDALQVLPPMEPGIEDKIILLRASKSAMPMPTGTDAEREAFQKRLVGELPGFLHWLIHEHRVPQSFSDDRFQVRTWQHPELTEKLKTLSKQSRLLALIDASFPSSLTEERKPWTGTARDLCAYLLEKARPDAEDRKLLSNQIHLGMLLGGLAELQPARFQAARSATERCWRIQPPTDDTLTAEMQV